MERLIEEVRRFPALYDQTHEKYRNIDYKDRVWKKIAAELTVKGGGEECKKKWASIRDQLRRTLQKRKTASGQAAVSHRKYKYEDLLEFLVPHMAERETFSNVPSLEDTEVEIDNEDTADVTVDEESTDGLESMQQNREEEPEKENQKSQEEIIATNTSLKGDKFVRPTLKRKIQRLSKPQESASSQLMTYILSEKEAEKQSKKISTEETVQHPVDAFLAGIAPPLKSLDPILLNQAKSRIFSIVQEFEMKQLMASQEPYVCRSFPLVPSSQSPFSPASTSSGSVPTPYT